VRVLVVGAGGVGAAVARIAARREFVESLVLADIDPDRAARAAAAAGSERVSATSIDASDIDAVVSLAVASRADAVLNATDPRFVLPVFTGCLRAGVTYLDMAMSLSRPHPDRPCVQTGVKLGDEQFAMAGEWEARGALALVGMGVEPGLSDVFARYAADHLFAEVDEVAVRDGADLVVEGHPFAPTFSVWTTIEECLNPPVVWERDRGWYTTEPFSEPEVFDFPAGIGPVECVNVEHEEVLLRRVRRGAPGAAHGRTGPHRPGDRARRHGLAARRGRGLPARPGYARRPDARPDLRRHPGHRGGRRRAPPGRVPLPGRGQRVVDAGVRGTGGGLAGSGQPGGGAGTPRLRCLDRVRRARAGSLRRRAVPRPARPASGPLGDAPAPDSSSTAHVVPSTGP
jgi:hypothetical protein